MIGEFLLENAVETARLRKRDVLKKKYEANLKCYIEYKLKQFYRGILAEYMINNKKGGLEATHL